MSMPPVLDANPTISRCSLSNLSNMILTGFPKSSIVQMCMMSALRLISLLQKLGLHPRFHMPQACWADLQQKYDLETFEGLELLLHLIHIDVLQSV